MTLTYVYGNKAPAELRGKPVDADFMSYVTIRTVKEKGGLTRYEPTVVAEPRKGPGQFNGLDRRQLTLHGKYYKIEDALGAGRFYISNQVYTSFFPVRVLHCEVGQQSLLFDGFTKKTIKV